jgi:hypothetical protein
MKREEVNCEADDDTLEFEYSDLNGRDRDCDLTLDSSPPTREVLQFDRQAALVPSNHAYYVVVLRFIDLNHQLAPLDFGCSALAS